MNSQYDNMSGASEPWSPRRLIFRLPNWVGDTVMALPALRAVRNRWPDIFIAGLAHARCVSLLPPDLVDRTLLVCTGGSVLRNLWDTANAVRALHCDAGIILPNSFSSALLFTLAGIPRRIGYAADGRSFLLCRAVPFDERLHRSATYQRLAEQLWLPAAGGMPAHGLRTTTPGQSIVRELLADAGIPDTSRLVLLAPGSQASSRQWPVERFIQLALTLIREHHCRVGLLGSPAERPFCDEIAEHAGAGPVVNLAGVIPLQYLVDCCALAAAVVSNDNGAAHIAAASGTPTCVFFGAGDKRITGPAGSRVTIIDKAVDCSPCVKNHCRRKLECLTAITVEEVLDEVLAAFSSRRPAPESLPEDAAR